MNIRISRNLRPFVWFGLNIAFYLLLTWWGIAWPVPIYPVIILPFIDFLYIIFVDLRRVARFRIVESTIYNYYPYVLISVAVIFLVAYDPLKKDTILFCGFFYILSRIIVDGIKLFWSNRWVSSVADSSEYFALIRRPFGSPGNIRISLYVTTEWPLDGSTFNGKPIKHFSKVRRSDISGLSFLDLTIFEGGDAQDLVSVRKFLSEGSGRPFADPIPSIRESVDFESVVLRPKTVFDPIEFQPNETVLITGGAGTIGGGLVVEILSMPDTKVVCIDKDEQATQKIAHKFRDSVLSGRLSLVIADVTSYSTLHHYFSCHRPTMVFHAAAYKHVDLVEESGFFPFWSNVASTHVIANLCKEFDVRSSVLVSSDKAVNPTNLMGASKRICEEIWISSGNSANRIVRFGNVFDSSGSAISTFRTQILEGGPVRVTHPDITRYFMSVTEAVHLVMTASLMPQTKPRLYVLKMGDPLLIRDIAEKMIRLSGMTPYYYDSNRSGRLPNAIEIKYIGLRPGEKMYEELWDPRETLESHDISEIYVLIPRQLNLDTFIDNIVHTKHMGVFELKKILRSLDIGYVGEV
jgi:nucleoside-diphosphate-sugar epimerase